LSKGNEVLFISQNDESPLKNFTHFTSSSVKFNIQISLKLESKTL